ncbi:dipeptide ABC transporter ATP-binding protein [Bacillus sp. JCM 19041]|uniref:ABC transporter ATP-binding protein n=1 Tax=Bacillus sp. JCM 19041 TaxID=1460637 RepID=UPI000A9F994F
MDDVIMRVDGLSKSFLLKSGPFKKNRNLQAVRDVSLDIRKGQTFSLVGESGCGKSTTGRLLSRLLQPDEGTIRFAGEQIESKSKKEMKPLYRRMQMVFQDPYASLNPRMKVLDLVAEPLDIHEKLGKKDRERKVLDMLEIVGLNHQSAYKYAHEFSGGQRQRLGIARALMVKPDLIIADEPVSALDVSIQSQILNLFDDLQKEFNLAYLFISHDLSVVEHISDHVGVMYLGSLVESGTKEDVFGNPMHPYTQALMSAVPLIASREEKRERILLKGDLPSPVDPPSGCSFHTRCPAAVELCKQMKPKLINRSGFSQQVSCHLYNEINVQTEQSVIH